MHSCCGVSDRLCEEATWSTTQVQDPLLQYVALAGPYPQLEGYSTCTYVRRPLLGSSSTVDSSSLASPKQLRLLAVASLAKSVLGPPRR